MKIEWKMLIDTSWLTLPWKFNFPEAEDVKLYLQTPICLFDMKVPCNEYHINIASNLRVVNIINCLKL